MGYLCAHCAPEEDPGVAALRRRPVQVDDERVDIRARQLANRAARYRRGFDLVSEGTEKRGPFPGLLHLPRHEAYPRHIQDFILSRR